MRRETILFLFFCLAAVAAGALHAEQPDAAAPPSEQQAQPAQQAQQAAAAPPATPADKDERVTATIDFGYRWVVRQNGNFNMYRSIVNLGEGPKLLGANLSFRSPNAKLADRVDVELNSWGGEPYNTARLDARRAGIYDLGFQYRNISYYNNIPSFANALSAFGSQLSENAYDIHRRLFDVQLDIFPNHRIAPFFTYSRSAGTGPGLITFVGPGNEYLSNRRIDDAVDVFRGGAHLNFSKANLTLEAGGTKFHDDQRVFYGPGASNPGDLRVPLLGQTLRLDTVNQQYSAGITGFFTRGSAVVRPYKWIDLTGDFSFNQPSLDSRFTEAAAGNFVFSPALRNNTGQTVNALANALRPHPSGTASMTLRPINRVRIVQSYYTDRFHLSSFSVLNQTLTGVVGLLGSVLPPTITTSTPNAVFFTNNYNRYQVEGMVDVHPRITLRGGYRKIWTDVVHGDPSDPAGADLGRQRQQVGLAGLDLRVMKDLTVYATAEASSGDSALFRTSPLNYQRVKIRGRYRPRTWATISGTVAIIRNFNGAPDIDLSYRNRETSLSLLLTPGGGKRLSVALDYMHSTLASDMFILLVPFFDRSISRYDQNAHTAGAYVNIGLMKNAQLSFGGTMMISDGSRPTRFYQPKAETVVPLVKHVGWLSEWRYYDFNEANFRFEGFSTHLFATGLRITL